MRERAELAAKQAAELDAGVREKAALLAEKAEAADTLRIELNTAKASLDGARKDIIDLRTCMSALQETLEQERKQADEKLALLSDARERMGKEFKVLAEEVMTKHGESFTRQNKEQVEGILTPLRDKLAEFQLGLQAAHTESVKDRATLAEQIKQLSEHSAKMSTEKGRTVVGFLTQASYDAQNNDVIHFQNSVRFSATLRSLQSPTESRMRLRASSVSASVRVSATSTT